MSQIVHVLKVLSPEHAYDVAADVQGLQAGQPAGHLGQLILRDIQVSKLNMF